MPNNLLKESFLLGALDRIGRNSFSYGVLYVSVSKLKPKNRPPEFVKILAKLFESVVEAAKGSLYVMSNGDFVILARHIAPNLVEEAVKQLREGLASDPILDSQDSSEFAQVYHFPERFDEFYGYVQEMMNSQTEKAAEEEPKRPLESGDVDELLSELNKMDIADIIKRQSVMRMKKHDDFEVIFQEFFVAVKDLAIKFNDGINLTASKWLFMYLSQRLDKKTMSSFAEAELTKWPKKISLNLNLSSLFSKEFDSFLKHLPVPDCQIIVEVKMMDIFNNNQRYLDARKLLHEKGHLLLLDEMSPRAMKMLDINSIKPDMVKMFWEPLLEYEPKDIELLGAIEAFGRDNVVLAKVENEKAIKWGTNHGISAFQGPFIDNIETMIVKSKCPKASYCTNLECLKRRRLLKGELRDQCYDKTVLDELLQGN